MKATQPPEASPEQPAPPSPAAPSEPVASAPVSPPAPPTPPARPANWPEWFAAVDISVMILVAVIGFLTASFAARNADLWLHLANGRLIAEGKIHPGTDPFSFSGADRAWTDSSWLFDLGLYAVYSADPTGAGVVAVKAVMFSLAFGVLVFLRKPGQALWPWAVLIALGMIASCPYSTLRSLVPSMLFLSATLLIVFRKPWQPGSWKQPGILGGLFWIWACTDHWFLLGPLTLLVIWIGEKLNPVLTGSHTQSETEQQVFWPVPSSSGLLRALALGVLGCLLNPMFLGAVAKDPSEAVTQLVPIEMGFFLPPGYEEDPDIFILVSRPFTEDFYWSRPNQPDEELKLPATLFTILFVGTALSLVAGYRRLQATHIMLWIVFGALAFLHVRLIPFFAIIAIPLAAGHLNGLSTQIRLGTWIETQTRLILTGSALGRVLTVAAALIAVAAAYPGWLHAPSSDPAYTNRVDWVVSPDTGFQRSAQLLPKVRSLQKQDSSVRGFTTSAELGSYIAWFARDEKVFFDTRYVFHRKEFSDLLVVRQNLLGKKKQFESAMDADDVLKICETNKTDFFVHATPYYRQLNERRVFTLINEDDKWSIWHLDGRCTIIGRSKAQTSGKGARPSLFDPSLLAFGPEQTPMPEGKAVPMLLTPEPGWAQFWVDYLARPDAIPPETDDAHIYTNYAFFTAERNSFLWQKRIGAIKLARGALLGALAGGIPSAADQQAIEDDQLALPVLAVRAARRAVAAAPDRPEVYHALASAYQHQLVPTTDLQLPGIGMSEHQMQLITAIARFMSRIPAVDRCTVSMARVAFVQGRQLSQLYLESGQTDLARDTLKKTIPYAKMLPAEVIREFIPQGVKAEDPVKMAMKSLEDELDRLSRQVQQQSDFVSRQTGPTRKFRAAAQRGLPARAIQIFKDTPDPNEFGNEKLQIVIEMIALELRAGFLEQASADLTEMDTQIKSLASRQPNDPGVQSLRSLQGIKARIEGNYPAAGEVMDHASLPPVNSAIAKQSLSAPNALLGLQILGGSTTAFIVTSDGAKSKAPLPLAFINWMGTREALALESTYQYDRALLALNDANIAEAERRFELTLRPQGIDVSVLVDGSRLSRAKRYLELIRRYKNNPAPDKTGARP